MPVIVQLSEEHSELLDRLKEARITGQFDSRCVSLAYHDYEAFAEALAASPCNNKAGVLRSAYPEAEALDTTNQFNRFQDADLICCYIKTADILNPEDKNTFLISIAKQFPWGLISRSTANAILDSIINMIKLVTPQFDLANIIGIGGHSLFIRAMKNNDLDNFLKMLLGHLPQKTLKDLLVTCKDEEGRTVAHYIESRHNLVEIVPLLSQDEIRQLLIIIKETNKFEIVKDFLRSVNESPSTSVFTYQLLTLQDQGLIESVFDLNELDWYARKYLRHLSTDDLVNYIFNFLPKNRRDIFVQLLGNAQICKYLVERLHPLNQRDLLKIILTNLRVEDLLQVHPESLCAFLHIGYQSGMSILSFFINHEQARHELDCTREQYSAKVSRYLTLRLAFHDAQPASQSRPLTQFGVPVNQFTRLIAEIEELYDFRWVDHVIQNTIDNELPEASPLRKQLVEILNSTPEPERDHSPSFS